jgi:phosphoenolpyruvate-protein kinase (PTS system EI component)
VSGLTIIARKHIIPYVVGTKNTSKIIKNRSFTTVDGSKGIAQKVPKGYIPQKQGNIITYPILSGLHHHYERLSA